MLLVPAHPRSSDVSGIAVDCPDGVVNVAPVTATVLLSRAKFHCDASVPSEPATLSCSAPSRLWAHAFARLLAVPSASLILKGSEAPAVIVVVVPLTGLTKVPVPDTSCSDIPSLKVRLP